MTPIRGYVFDAYGTLFDVHAVVEAGCLITRDPAALSAMWRQKQLEYTWLRALMGRYEDFWAVTESALRYAIRRLDLTASEAQVRRLMEAYLSLACFPEVAGALERLAERPRAILSNGAPAMLVGELLFVSSNAWDVAGAKAFGYRAASSCATSPSSRSSPSSRTVAPGAQPREGSLDHAARVRGPCAAGFHPAGRRTRSGCQKKGGPPEASRPRRLDARAPYRLPNLFRLT
jgi:HAD superfamily hydrolase (TIGR01493 family)